jgi:hypothetical protein
VKEVWLQRELPWVGSGFIHRLPAGGADGAIADLERLRSRVFRRVLRRVPRRVAVVWTDANRLALDDLKAFAEAVCLFSDHSRMHRKTGYSSSSSWGRRPVARE